MAGVSRAGWAHRVSWSWDQERVGGARERRLDVRCG